jgi:hypothetical protein
MSRIAVEATEASGSASSLPGEQSPYEFDAGVLFVHGIGAQPRGDTLTHFAEPIVAAIEWWFHGVTDRWASSVTRDAARSWLNAVVEPALNGQSNRDGLREAAHAFCRLIEEGGSNRVVGENLSDQVPSSVVLGDVRLREAIIKARAADLDAPPHAQLDISSLSIDGTAKTTTILLAEAWWASTFISPTFAQLVSWGLRIVPLTLGTHFGAQLRRALARCFREQATGWQRPLRVLQATAASVYFLLAVLLCPLVLALLVVIFILALPPIAPLRAWLLQVQQMLAGTVGDCFVLADSPMRRAAIVAQSKHDLQWLARRCRSVLIVAHSQGAAVTHLVLREARPPEVVEIVTFGSGLQKLGMLMQEATMRATKWGWMALGGLFLFGLNVQQLLQFEFQYPAVWYEWVMGPQIDAILGMLMRLIVGLLLMVLGFTALIQGVPLIQVEFWEEQIRRLGVKWRDYYASADPVPNGPLFGEGELTGLQEPQFSSSEIVNYSSLVSDHTSYWSNREQFVMPLAHRIARMGGIELGNLLPEDARALEIARRARILRVRCLVAARWIILIAACAMIYLHWASLWAVGKSIGDAIVGDRKVFATLTEIVASGQARSVATVAAMFALYGATLIVWQWWRWLDWRELWRRAGGFEFFRLLALSTLAWPVFFAVMWLCEAALTERVEMAAQSAATWAQRIASGVMILLAIIFCWLEESSGHLPLWRVDPRFRPPRTNGRRETALR